MVLFFTLRFLESRSTDLSALLLRMSPEEKQTMMWCASLPNNKKKIENMMVVFIGGYAKFVPKRKEVS